MKPLKTQPNIGKRALASIIDYTLLSTLIILYITHFGEYDGYGNYSVDGLKTMPIFLSWLLFFPLVESINGQTLGHRLVGLKVVDISGESISFLQALKRRILDPIDLGLYGLIAFIVVKNSERHQRVGDAVAKTLVIGGETAKCFSCGELLTLSPEDTLTRAYECPVCSHPNEL